MDTTIVTPRLIQKYVKSGNVLEEFLQNKFRGGATPLEILTDKDCTLECAHALVTYVRLNEIEQRAYNEFCHINNSTNVFSSNDINNSSFILSSKNISHSNFIRYSNDISNSQYVYSSKQIEMSNYVFNSSNLKNCDVAMGSDSCEYSSQIVDSKRLNWIDGAVNCTDAEECHMIYNCTKIINCDWCFDVKDSQNCMFCFGLQNANLCILNQQYGADEYEKIAEELRQLADFGDLNVINLEMNNGVYHFNPIKHPSKFFHLLPASVAEFIKTLPDSEKWIGFNI